MADSDSDEGLSPFVFGSNLAEKSKSQTEINSLSRKIIVSPHNSTYKSSAQMSRGKRKVYLRKRAIQEEEELDRVTRVVPSCRRK